MATRRPVWAQIRATLAEEIAAGQYRPGARLPTEAALAARFGVNRHTVRRALGDLAEAGITQSRRGAGVFVTTRPMDYPIGKRTRFHSNLAEAGQIAAREVLRLETRAADAREAAALEIAPGDAIHVWEGVSFADGLPIALFRSAFPAARLPGLRAALGAAQSVTAALAQIGVPDYTRRSTRLSAEAADATQALHLRCAQGAPLLRTVAVNVDPEGRPVEYGRSWFAGDRIQLVVEGT